MEAWRCAFIRPGFARDGSNLSKKMAAIKVTRMALPSKVKRATRISVVQSTPIQLKIPVIVPGSPSENPLI